MEDGLLRKAEQPQTQEDRSSLISNVFLLLSFSMVPTLAGMWIGLETRYGFELITKLSPGFLALALFAFDGALIWLIEKNKTSGWGIFWLMALTFSTGYTLSPIMLAVMSLSNGFMIVTVSLIGSIGLFLIMGMVGIFTDYSLDGIGGFLTGGVLLVAAASFANLALQIPALSLVTASCGVLIFSGFVAYDMNRMVRGGETNYITITTSLYLDFINLFLNLLRLMTALLGKK